MISGGDEGKWYYPRWGEHQYNFAGSGNPYKSMPNFPSSICVQASGRFHIISLVHFDSVQCFNHQKHFTKTSVDKYVMWGVHKLCVHLKTGRIGTVNGWEVGRSMSHTIPYTVLYLVLFYFILLYYIFHKPTVCSFLTVRINNIIIIIIIIIPYSTDED